MVAALKNATSLVTFAPAKLNLFLELHGRRPDGFHDLETVMLAINRCDRLRFALRDDAQIVIRTRWAPSAAVWRERLGVAADAEAAEGKLLMIPSGSDNLVSKALAAFRETFTSDSSRSAMRGFDVELEKQIPAGAGMGGASSDAAAALRAAATFAGISLQDPRLWELAGRLGSDVPFFLGVPPAACDRPAVAAEGPPADRCRAVRATGRGEKLSPLEMHGDLHFVVCYPPQALSTAEVYRNCSVPERPTAVEPLRDALLQVTGRSLGACLFNRLSEPARTLSPRVERILQEMRTIGLANAQMTGSGSACFAIAPTQRRARRAAQLLSSRRLGITMVARSMEVPTQIIRQTV